ncbi:uncharacterized protein LOC117337064 [Pecten maximus]|uniref:uncharacterized protein LOC117337064 n=1 Tax=Pecten maximus TaxID=6579 RepID=UPI0014581A47|nr:uncharacterized protein LOC117337064 [Pecten maximus]
MSEYRRDMNPDPTGPPAKKSRLSNGRAQPTQQTECAKPIVGNKRKRNETDTGCQPTPKVSQLKLTNKEVGQPSNDGDQNDNGEIEHKYCIGVMPYMEPRPVDRW